MEHSIAPCDTACAPAIESPHPIEAPEGSVPTPSAGGAASFEQPSASIGTAAASEPMDVEEQLRQEWRLLGRPAGYEAPPVQELRDLADSRHRKRGQKAQRARLKRNRQQLERERLAERQPQQSAWATSEAVPHYLLDRRVVSRSAPLGAASDLSDSSSDEDDGSMSQGAAPA